MKKLVSYPKQRGPEKTLRGIRRIERALFMLDWFRDPSPRRRIQAGLKVRVEKGSQGDPFDFTDR